MCDLFDGIKYKLVKLFNIRLIIIFTDDIVLKKSYFAVIMRIKPVIQFTEQLNYCIL